MTTVSAYLITRADYSTTNLPLAEEQDATPGGSITMPSHTDPLGTTYDWLAPRTLASTADELGRILGGHPANPDSLFTLGFKAVRVEYDDAADVTTAPCVKRLDCIEEVDAATLEAAAPLPARYYNWG